MSAIASLSLPQPHPGLVAVCELDAGGFEGAAHCRLRVLRNGNFAITLNSLDGWQR
jgi:hypothetical protein